MLQPPATSGRRRRRRHSTTTTTFLLTSPEHLHEEDDDDESWSEKSANSDAAASPHWWSATDTLEFILPSSSSSSSPLSINHASLERFAASTMLFRSTYTKLRAQAGGYSQKVSIPIVFRRPQTDAVEVQLEERHIERFGNVLDWPQSTYQDIKANRLVVVTACFTELPPVPPAPVLVEDEAAFSLVEIMVHSSQQGARRTMEDFYVIAHQAEYKLFAVFDGHCGPRAAELCAELFSPTFRHHLSSVSVSVSSSSSRQDYKHALLATVAQLERTILLDLAPNTAAAPAVLLDAESIIARLSGTCLCACVCAAKQLFVCNLGDSRAVLSRRGKLAQLLTPFDHNTDNADEVRRILLEGGTVVDKRVVGENKGKYSSLSISRSIGDLDFTEHTGAFAKAVGISPLPDVFAYDLDEEVDEFVILGCDGVWEAVSADRACALVRQTLRRTQGDLQQAADELVGAALAGFATDNVTVLIAALPAMPRIWAAAASSSTASTAATSASAASSPPPPACSVTPEEEESERQRPRFNFGGLKKMIV